MRGAGATLFAQAATYSVQLGALSVLARLLVPSDFGLMALVTTFSIFLASIVQIGIPEAILQREDIDTRVASNIFWTALGLAAGLTVAFAATGLPLAKLYGDPRISRVVEISSVSIFFTGASVVHVALLDRAMHYSANAANTFASRLISVVVAVLLARGGAGYWALVGGVIAQPLAYAIGAWSLCWWIPMFPRRANGTKSLLSFALNVNAMGNITYWTRNMDNLLVGWRFGSSTLGFYKKAYDLFMLPTNQMLSLFPVAVSTLSRLTRDPARYRQYLLGGLSALALLGMGAAGALTLVGGDVVRLILGPAWGTSGLIFRFFAPGIGVLLIYRATTMIHLSIGTPGRLLRWTILEFAVTGLLFLIGLHWGAVGVAAAWTVSPCILLIPAFRYAGKPIQLHISMVLEAIWRPVLASAVAGIASAVSLKAASLPLTNGVHDALVRVLTQSLLFLVLYTGTIIALYGGCKPLYSLTNLFREMLPFGRNLGSQPADLDGLEAGVQTPTIT